MLISFVKIFFNKLYTSIYLIFFYLCMNEMLHTFFNVEFCVCKTSLFLSHNLSLTNFESQFCFAGIRGFKCNLLRILFINYENRKLFLLNEMFVNNLASNLTCKSTINIFRGRFLLMQIYAFKTLAAYTISLF